MKKILYHLTDTVGNIDETLSLNKCMDIIAEDMKGVKETDELEEGFAYTLNPVWVDE